jgi:hypothetical protein
MTRLTTRVLFALCCAPLACSGDPKPTAAPSQPQQPAVAVADAGAPVPDAAVEPAWLAVETGTVTAADWYVVDPDAERDLLGRAEVVAVGRRSAVLTAKLAGSKPVVIGVDLSTGVLGWLQLPAPMGPETIVGIGGAGDQLFVHPKGGPLLRAASVEAAVQPDAFAPVAGAPAATFWAFAPGYVLAGEGRSLWVSKNGGTFRRSRLARGESVVGVELGSGGQMLARVELPSGIYQDRVSLGGRRWSKAAWQNGSLTREAGWLYSDDCTQRIAMARRTTKFMKVTGLPQPKDYQPTSAMAATGRDLVIRPAQAYATAVRPKPPVVDRARLVKGKRGYCGGRMGSGIGYGTGYPKGVLGLLRVTHGPRPQPTPRQLSLFHDGACADADAVLEPSGVPTGSCKDGAAVTRPPHLVAGDLATGAAEVLEPPAGCVPRGAHSAGGLRVLLCRDGAGTRFYARTGDRWVDEGTVAVGDDGMASRVGQATDGSLGFAPSCTGEPPCAIAVRSPAPAGDGRWRLIRRDRAYGYRVLTGGRVLAVVLESETDAERATIGLVEIGPDGDKVLVSGIEVDSLVAGLSASVNGVFLTLRTERNRRASYRVRSDGALVPLAGPVR